MNRFSFRAHIVACLVCLSLAACTGDGPAGEAGSGVAAESSAAVTVYSGRNERLIGPILERFTEQSGIAVVVRYGETAELAATLLEEGPATPAEVFISQDAAALGAVAGEGMLRPLPADVLDRLPARFVDPAGRWVGLSGRARVLVYNRDAMTPEELPQTLEDVGDPRYRGRFGVAPLNGSFQAHMAVYGELQGAEALDNLLAGLVGNDPQRYPKNSAIVAAVIAGEVDFGLVNHYYLWRALQEEPGAAAANYFQPGGGASSFINVAGAGVLVERAEAVELVRFLVSNEAQRYFADETYEYPLAGEVEPVTELVALSELDTPKIDYTAVAAGLSGALAAIDRSGLVQ